MWFQTLIPAVGTGRLPHIWKSDSVNADTLLRALGVSLLVYILAQRYGHGTNTVWGVSGVIWVAENDRDVPVG